jgi:hypothetical protein
MPAPYTEGDIADAFVTLTEAAGQYLDTLETRGVARDVFVQLEREARGALNEAHKHAADIVAWLSAETDDEIDDAALDEVFDLDEEDEDDLDDLDEE